MDSSKLLFPSLYLRGPNKCIIDLLYCFLCEVINNFIRMVIIYEYKRSQFMWPSSKACDIYEGDLILAESLFNSDIPALGNKKSNNLLGSPEGRKLVNELLNKMEMGEFSWISSYRSNALSPPS